MQTQEGQKNEEIKGQLFSKGLVGIVNSSKKRAKKTDHYYVTSRSTCFRSFFGKIEDNKKSFRN